MAHLGINPQLWLQISFYGLVRLVEKPAGFG
jgi:hypothetical protein